MNWKQGLVFGLLISFVFACKDEKKFSVPEKKPVKKQTQFNPSANKTSSQSKESAKARTDKPAPSQNPISSAPARQPDHVRMFPRPNEPQKKKRVQLSVLENAYELADEYFTNIPKRYSEIENGTDGEVKILNPQFFMLGQALPVGLELESGLDGFVDVKDSVYAQAQMKRICAHYGYENTSYLVDLRILKRSDLVATFKEDLVMGIGSRYEPQYRAIVSISCKDPSPKDSSNSKIFSKEQIAQLEFSLAAKLYAKRVHLNDDRTITIESPRGSIEGPTKRDSVFAKESLRKLAVAYASPYDADLGVQQNRMCRYLGLGLGNDQFAPQTSAFDMFEESLETISFHSEIPGLATEPETFVMLGLNQVEAITCQWLMPETKSEPQQEPAPESEPVPSDEVSE